MSYNPFTITPGPISSLIKINNNTTISQSGKITTSWYSYSCICLIFFIVIISVSLSCSLFSKKESSQHISHNDESESDQNRKTIY
jgi:hypothetical protein